MEEKRNKEKNGFEVYDWVLKMMKREMERLEIRNDEGNGIRIENEEF